MAGSSQTTSVVYSHKSVSDQEALGQSGEWWIRLEQLDPEQIASDKTTLKEAADIVDAVYELDPCSDPGATGGGEEASTEPPISQEEYTALVRGQLDIPTCEDLENGYRVYLYVFRSNLSFPYELELSYGEIERTEHISETVEEFVVFADESQYSLSKPSFLQDYEPGQIPNLTVEFLTDFYTIEGILENPRAELSIVGSTLNFDQRVTGSLKITYPSRYDVVTILMEVPQNIVVRAFYHGIVVDTDMHPRILDDLDVDDCLNGFSRKSTVRFFGPDDACYQVVEAETRCQCSGDIQASSRELVVTSCKDDDPSGTIYDYKGLEYTYVDCQETEELYDPQYYLETCCQPVPPNKTLPLCEERKEIFMGGEEIENGKDYWRAIYGPDTAFIALGPEDQLECGEITHKWLIDDKDCCGPGLPTFAWTQTVDFIGWGDTEIFCVTGGAAPYSWETEGAGLVVEAQWSTATGGCARIKANDCHCKPLYVKVTDACDQVLQHDVASDEGFWEEIPNEENPLYIPGSLYTATNGAQIDSANRTFVYETEEYRLTQDMSLKVDYTGCNYTSCTNPVPLAEINWDYRCWGRNPGSWGDTASLFDPFGNGSASDWPDDLPSSGHWPYKWNDLQGVTYWSGGNWDSTAGKCGLGGVSNPVWVGVYGYDIETAVSHKWVCPNAPDELVYDEDNSLSVLADNSNGYIYWTGGKAPFTITITQGSEIYFDADHTVSIGTTSAQQIRIYSGDICGWYEVTITDKCSSSVTGDFKATEGQWITAGATTPSYKGWLVDNVDGIDSCSPGNAYMWDTDINPSFPWYIGPYVATGFDGAAEKEYVPSQSWRAGVYELCSTESAEAFPLMAEIFPYEWIASAGYWGGGPYVNYIYPLPNNNIRTYKWIC